MAWPPGKHIEALIAAASQKLTDVRIMRREVGLSRALIDLEGQWGRYRVIVSEIHRADGSLRYAYYVLDEENRLIYGCDNSPDNAVTRLRYGADWKSRLHEEIPHEHDAAQRVALAASPMSFESLIEWMERVSGKLDT